MHYVNAEGILSAQNSMNVYRGCSHGCIYCDARSSCYGFHYAFEDIEVKRNAPELLNHALYMKRKPCMIQIGGTCDPYANPEEKLGMTRACLEIIARSDCGAVIMTRSSRILRDLSLLEAIQANTRCVVIVTMAAADEKLSRILEPKVSGPGERLELLKTLHDHQIPAFVRISPILPFINDTEENLKSLLSGCLEAGVMGILGSEMKITLRAGSREYFYAGLDKYFPGMRIRYIRNFGNSGEFASPNARSLRKLLGRTCREKGILYRAGECSAYLRECPVKYQQMELTEFLK